MQSYVSEPQVSFSIDGEAVGEIELVLTPFLCYRTVLWVHRQNNRLVDGILAAEYIVLVKGSEITDRCETR